MAPDMEHLSAAVAPAPSVQQQQPQPQPQQQGAPHLLGRASRAAYAPVGGRVVELVAQAAGLRAAYSAVKQVGVARGCCLLRGEPGREGGG